MRLATFIRTNLEAILQDWENFAATLVGSAHHVSQWELRDHAGAILNVIALDLETGQAVQEGIDKSRGLAPSSGIDTAAEIHAAERLACGFTIEQLLSEFRALRAGVLRLWLSQENAASFGAAELDDIIRFNEAIDQAVAESVARYSTMLRESQNLFLAILGHDVRTPLGAISMNAQILQNDGTMPPRAATIAARILNSVKRVADIVSDLLDFSGSHLGDGIPVAPNPMDLTDMVRQVVDEARSFHPGRVIVLAIGGNLQVVWDQARMAQALANLIANAADHGTGGKPLRVSVIAVGDDHIELRVQNEGGAIPSTTLRTLFDPARRFAMRPASERAIGGNLGLGLYITREIVVAHGGGIEVTSSAAGGTTFVLRLPRNGRIQAGA
jgi:signal transduction histidine kinase